MWTDREAGVMLETVNGGGSFSFIEREGKTKYHQLLAISRNGSNGGGRSSGRTGNPWGVFGTCRAFGTPMIRFTQYDDKSLVFQHLAVADLRGNVSVLEVVSLTNRIHRGGSCFGKHHVVAAGFRSAAKVFRQSR